MTEHPNDADSGGFPPDIHTAVGAYAVDALDPTQRAEFEQHLAGCASCRDELLQLATVAVHLSALTATEPPASLRDRTLAQISRTRQEPSPSQTPSDDDSGASAPAQAHSTTGATTNAETIDEVALASARRSARVARWVSAAAIIVALVAGGGYAYGRHQLQQARQQIHAATSLFDAPDLRTATAPVSSGGKALVLASASEGRLLLTAHGLRVLDAAHTYQVWAIAPTGAPTSLGTFEAASGSVRAAMTGDLAGPITVGITVEPAGGSRQPTTKPIFAQKLGS